MSIQRRKQRKFKNILDSQLMIISTGSEYNFYGPYISPESTVTTIFRDYSTESFLIDDSYLRNKAILKCIKEYDEQKNKYPDHLKDFEEYANKAFGIVITDLLSVFDTVFLNTTSIDFSITDSPSLIFTMREYNQFSRIRYEIFVDTDELFVAFSVYKEDKLYARNSGNHYEIFDQLKLLLNKPTVTSFSSIHEEYISATESHSTPELIY